VSGFSNPIIGGGGALIYPLIKSPGYVPGVSGWAIFKNGNVEFNSGTFRGTVAAGSFTGADFLINATGAFFYSGIPAFGNLIASIASAAGTDTFGNAYLAGMVTYGPGPSISQMTASQLKMGPASSFALGGAVTAAGLFQIFSPRETSGDTLASLSLDSAVSSGTGNPLASINAATAITAGGLAVTGGTSTDTLAVSSAMTATGGTASSPTLITTDTWHSLALANGWTGQCFYRLQGTGRVELWVGILSATATAFQFGTMPAAYIPASAVYIAAGATANVAANIAPYVEIDTSGNITMNGLHAFSAAGTWLAGGTYPLSAV